LYKLAPRQQPHAPQLQKHPSTPSNSENRSLKTAKSAHISAAPQKQTTKPIPPSPPVPKSPTTKKKRKVVVYLRLNQIKPQRTENPIKSTNIVPENPKKSTKKIPENTNKSTKKIPEESSKKVSLKSAKKSEKKNEEIVKPVKMLDKKLEPVKIAKKCLVISRSPPENPPENSRTVAQQTHSTDALGEVQLLRMNKRKENRKTQQLPNSLGVLLMLKLSSQPDSNNWLLACTNPAHNHPVEKNNIDTSSQPLTLEIKEEIKELLRNGMKPKKISEELPPEYPNHQSLQLKIMNWKTNQKPEPPEDSLVQQLRESLADSSLFNETKYNKDGDINSIILFLLNSS
ncbi:hypothetical protein PSHT_01406, partial [Puccinia striiformis]